MRDAPALVILAAGMGSRYGGPKQLAPVGPGGALLMDYTIYDARRAGFRRVVFVVRPDLEAEFTRLVRERYAGRIEARLALQRLEDVPAGVAVPARRKPWGTAHAVLAAEGDLSVPFAVLNADDFYGRGALAQAAQFFARRIEPGPPAVFANVAYPLGQTLSATGGVNRAWFRLSGDGWLEAVEEILDIRRLDDSTCAGADARGRAVEIESDALISMNLWLFTPAVFAMLRRGFAEFLKRQDVRSAEFLIPHAMQDAVARGEARVRVLRSSGRWLGLTQREDRPLVEATLRELVAAGEYPERLWE
jgi:hypothetical protein